MDNKRFYGVAVLACLVMLAQSANAAKGFKYSYGDFGAQHVEAVTGNGNGFLIDFSFNAGKYVNLLGEYNRIFGISNVDMLNRFKNPTNVSLDRDEFKIGLGVHYPLMDNLDVTFAAQYVDQEFSGEWTVPPIAPLKSNLSTSEQGYEAELGARIKVFKKLELVPRVVYRDIGIDNNIGGGIGLVYKFYKKLSVSVKTVYFSDDGASNTFAGVRLDL